MINCLPVRGDGEPLCRADQSLASVHRRPESTNVVRRWNFWTNAAHGFWGTREQRFRLVSPVCAWNGRPLREAGSFQKPPLSRRRVNRGATISISYSEDTFLVPKFSFNSHSRLLGTTFLIFLVLPKQFEISFDRVETYDHL